MKLAAVLCAAVAASSAQANEPTYKDLMETAQAAFQAEDWRGVADAFDAAQKIRPYSLFLARNRILAYTMLEELDAALAIAGKAADQGIALSLDAHPGFEALTSRDDFASVAEKFEENRTPLGESRIVLEIPRDDLLAENYVRDKKGARHYIGSVRTGAILRADGSTFATAPGGVYGLEIAEDRLIAVANSASPYEAPTDADAAASYYIYALDDAALIAKAAVKEADALLGDVEAIPGGVLASDSLTPRIFILRNDKDEPELFASDSRFVNLQGLAYDRKRKRIFVADYLAGIFSMNLDGGDIIHLANPSDAFLGGVDGLYLHRGDLIGIQNGASPGRIVRIDLNKKGDTAEALTVIQRALPEWREPTNGHVIGDTLFYVGTSNWPAYGDDGSVKADVERARARIFTAPLKE